MNIDNYDNTRRIYGSTRSSITISERKSTISKPATEVMYSLKDILNLYQTNTYYYDVLYNKIIPKWNYQAKQYRLQHPDMPPSKVCVGPHGKRTWTNMLPIDIAQQHIRRFVPWAVRQIRQELNDELDAILITGQFDALTIDELNEIGNEPEDSSESDEEKT